MDGIKTILIDFHGVLTDGKMSISHDGKYMFDHVHVRDIRAMRQLLAEGYEVVIVTSSDSDIIKRFAEKIKCEVHVARDKSDIPFTDFIAIGDDAWDVSMLRKAKKAFCPADADASVLHYAMKLNSKGGEGVIAELLTQIR